MKNLIYQAVLFGSYQEISPKPELIKYFMDKFSDKELIPNTFQELNNGNTLNRLNLINSDESWIIEFGSHRIDIHHTNRNIGVTEHFTLDKFISEIKSILNVIEEKYPKPHNRLSLVTKSLLDNIDEDIHQEVYHKLNNTISIYKENQIGDWSSKTVSRIPHSINNSEELFNVISTIKRTAGPLKVDSKDELVDSIELHFDINTFQGNTEYRFDITSAFSFFDKALELNKTLKGEYLELINYELKG
jgi:hypothetical protein